MQFNDFALRLDKLTNTSARLSITAELAELYQHLPPAEVLAASYLLEGRLLPAYQGVEFQLSQKMVLRSLSRLVANEPDALLMVTESFQKKGDVGEVAAAVIAKYLPSNSSADIHTVKEVYDQLLVIAQEQGEGSQERKLVLLTELLAGLSPVAAKVVVRVIMGTLRLGFSTMTLLDALSWARTGGKADRSALEAAYQKQADIGALATAYLSAKTDAEREEALNHYSVKVGVPVFPALCQRLNSAQEIIEKMSEVIAEPKYDGLRVQIHFRREKNGQVFLRTFTRSLEENTHMFPELAGLSKWLNCDECILDGEAIGYDPATGQLSAFQETITRKRKHGVAERAEDVPLRFFIFDVLSVDKKSQLSEKLQDRKELLEKLFKDNEVLVHAPYMVTTDPEKLHAFHTEVLEQGLEGAVIKQRYSSYQSGRKGWSWVKIKEEEGTRGKLSDTIDAIVLGYYHGKGKRAAFGLGAFLVGVVGADDQIVTVAKIGTGLSDDQFRELYQRAQSLVVATKPTQYQVSTALVPDAWLAPSLVAEVAADELTNSPQHTAGLALRFPRLVKFRDDKKWQDATTAVELHSMIRK